MSKGFQLVMVFILFVAAAFWALFAILTAMQQSGAGALIR